jgi:hypothetical protein
LFHPHFTWNGRSSGRPAELIKPRAVWRVGS